jgi:hypothetical protein
MKNLPWDEMVFTKRNRSYGAYILRKEYPSALMASVVFMLLVMSLLFLTSPVVFKFLRNIAGGKPEKKVIYIVKPPLDMANEYPKQSKPIKLK